MLISCKCTNITGYNNSVDEKVLRKAGSGQTLAEITPGSEDDGLGEFYYKYREFTKTAIGPISDLIETINLTDLAYEVPLKQLSVKYCINCKTMTHVKDTTTSEFWVNSKLLTTREKINALKNDELYSKVFNILMMTDSTATNKMDSAISTSPQSATSMATSTPTTPTSLNAPTSMDVRNLQNLHRQQAHIKKLTQHLEEQLKRDYNEANERISRFIEQQAAILESNREKAKQEYQILVSLINRVPDELKVINNNSTNNVNNNEDFTSSPAAIKSNPVTTTSTAASNPIDNQIRKTNIESTNVTSNVSDKTQQSLFTLKQEQQHDQLQLTTTSLDTPPATPDSTPMSVGNSPTFRQQTSIFGNSTSILGRNSMMSSLIGAGGIMNGGVSNPIDTDCMFDLDGMESYPISVSNANQMSDVEETEDAEDALGELEGVHIPRTRNHSISVATSLPICIANAIPTPRFTSNFDDLETEEISEERNLDIAASIKALAKSVHGNPIFGDLPRPRFSTQI